MFVFKIIKLPNILKEERYTRRGRKYYRKRSCVKEVMFLAKIAALIWLIMFFAGFFGGKTQKTEFAQYFKAEEGAYTQNLLEEDRLKKIEFEKKNVSDEPLIIIFHTHFSEEYADQKENGEKYTVADAGSKLSEIFSEKYGITVVHDMGEYDIVDKKVQRDGSYERSGEGVERLMEKYPSARVFIDLHRDAYKEGDEAVEIDGEKCALLMPVVGVCALDENGEKKSAGVENEYIDENLKFAYDFKKYCDKTDDSLCKQIYLKPYRYSTYHAPESMLLECGNEKSTFEEVENSLLYAAEAVVKSANIVR